MVMYTCLLDDGIMGDLEPHNLCLHFGFGYNRGIKLYFNRTKSPLPDPLLKKLPTNYSPFEQLQFALRNASHSSGTPIISNGSNASPRKFAVQHVCKSIKPRITLTG